MLFDRNKMQACATGGIGAPFAPGGEEIEPEPESGFEDGEHARTGPSAGQIVAPDKHRARLTGARIRAVVHVAVGGRIRRSFTVTSEFGGFDAHADDSGSIRTVQVRIRAKLTTPAAQCACASRACRRRGFRAAHSRRNTSELQSRQYLVCRLLL